MYDSSPDSDDEDSQDLGIVVRGSSGHQSGYQPAPARLRSPPNNPESTFGSASGIRKNQYVNGVLLGRGKIGKVFQCRNTNDGTHVAMKVVPKNSPMSRLQQLRRNNPGHKDRRFDNDSGLTTVRKEAELLRKCCHPNIVSFIDVIDDPQDANIYLVMENLEGGPIIWQDGNERPILTLSQIRRIMRDVILGLEYLHHEGIIHRDVKPQNMIWTADRSSVKLIDFGIAHYIPPANDTSSSRHGKGKQVEKSEEIDLSLFPESDLRKTVGTPAFLAPEVVWAGATEPSSSTTSSRPLITKSVDVWSLGVTFYCLLFGHLPFNPPDGENMHQKRSEYLLYQEIGTADWEPDRVMGIERVPIPSKNKWFETNDEPSQGVLVARLLYDILQKRPEDRILLTDVKANPWILRDITNPEEWIILTSQSKDTNPSSNWVKSAGKKFMKFIPRKV